LQLSARAESFGAVIGSGGGKALWTSSHGLVRTLVVDARCAAHEQGLELPAAMRVWRGFFRDGSGMAGADRVTEKILCIGIITPTAMPITAMSSRRKYRACSMRAPFAGCA